MGLGLATGQRNGMIYAGYVCIYSIATREVLLLRFLTFSFIYTFLKNIQPSTQSPSAMFSTATRSIAATATRRAVTRRAASVS